MAKFFVVDGYWKDDKEDKFENYLVTNSDWIDEPFNDDDSIFYYEITEQDIIEAIEKGINSDYEFVITSYEKGV